MWDELNQLTQVTKDGASVARMVYDASGSRILRTQGDTTTLYLGGSELSLNTTTHAVTANRYYTHADQTVAVRTGAANTTVTTLIADWQGTTHHQITAAGALTTTWQNPYGATRGTPPTTWTGERGFVGGTKDATGLTRIGARDYDPLLQRFITIDPIHVADPLQWNPYLYGNNSPITKSDPTGEAPEWVGQAAVVVGWVSDVTGFVPAVICPVCGAVSAATGLASAALHYANGDLENGASRLIATGAGLIGGALTKGLARSFAGVSKAVRSTGEYATRAKGWRRLGQAFVSKPPKRLDWPDVLVTKALEVSIVVAITNGGVYMQKKVSKSTGSKSSPIIGRGGNSNPNPTSKAARRLKVDRVIAKSDKMIAV